MKSPNASDMRRDWLDGGGEMSERIRAFDWTKTPLGPIDAWPHSLRTSVQIMLASRYQMFIWWGNELINLYNDAYAPLLGRRHPSAIAQPARQLWPEIWDVVGPQTEIVMRENRATWNDRVRLIMERNGFPEEMFVTWSYSPVLDDEGRAGGVFCVCYEETERVLGERRVATLRALAHRSYQAKSPDEACTIAAEELAKNAYDLPLALLYLLDGDGQRARLAGNSGITSGGLSCPSFVEVGGGSASWPFREVSDTSAPFTLTDLTTRFGSLTGGPWPEPVQQALVLPMIKQGQGQLAGFFVAGVSPRLPLDDNYRGFFDLVASQVATAVANAKAGRRASRTRLRASRSRRSRDRDVLMRVEADALAKLNELSSRLWTMQSLHEGLEEMLTATIALLGADMGNVQILNAAGVLTIAAQRGFEQDFLDFFAEVSAEHDSACGRALRSGKRIVIEDVETDAAFTSLRPVARAAGFRAMQSTPLIGRNGVRIGMLSTHFRTAHRPTQLELRRLDLYARQAAGYIERCQIDQILRDSEARLKSELDDSELLRKVSVEMTNRGGAALLYGRILDAAVVIMRSDYASVQMLYPDRGPTGELRLLDSRGFSPEAVAFWEWVRADAGSTCGMAMRIGRRVIVPDVETCTDMAGTDDRATYLQAGIRAVQSTPLMSRSGVLVGMLSTHWNEPHEPTERELRLFDILARQATHLIERTKAEETLRRNTETLATLIEQCPFGIYIVDSDFRIAQMNRRSQDGAFINVRPVIGRPFDEAMRILWPEAVAVDIIRNFRHTLDTGEPYYSSDFLKPRADTDGVEGYEWELHRIGLPDGQSGVICYYFESTRLRETEAALRANKEQLQDADRRKDEFLAMLAHELRNPLAPIRTGLEIIRLAGDSATSVERVRAMMERQVGHMVRLIDDLLDVSRITSGKIQLNRQPTTLAELVNGAIEANRAALDAARIQVRVDLADQPFIVDVDPTRMVQVLSNLLHNAAKFTPAGRHVDVSARCAIPIADDTQGELALTVADDGVGISPEMLSRVFDLFTQGQPPQGGQTQSGLGIGLALARRLVEMHGGRLDAASKGIGQGSTFTIYLPMTRALVTVDAPRSGVPAATVTCRVVVIDDNEDAAHATAMLIEALGGEARVALDGKTGVQAVFEFRPDVVLLDIGMPGMDGYETCRRIRVEPFGSDVFIVALTGWGKEQDKRRAIEAGFDSHLTKPADPTVLERILIASREMKVRVTGESC